MIEVVQAFGRAHIADLPTDDASSLETKLATARALSQDRAAWLQPRRVEQLRVGDPIRAETESAHWSRRPKRSGSRLGSTKPWPLARPEPAAWRN